MGATVVIAAEIAHIVFYDAIASYSEAANYWIHVGLIAVAFLLLTMLIIIDWLDGLWSPQLKPGSVLGLS